jgi:hypothetical protein
VVRFPESARDFFLFSIAPRPALGPTQPPLQWVRGQYPRSKAVMGVKLAAHLYLVPRSMVEIHVQFPTCPHGVLCNYIIKYRDSFIFTFVHLTVTYFGFIHFEGVALNRLNKYERWSSVSIHAKRQNKKISEVNK